MREILFKAKRIDNGEWVEGYYMKSSDSTGSVRHYICQSKSCIIWEHTEIDINTLCQYTGLTDKNGKKIWENDICDRKGKYPEVVKQYQGDWVLDCSYVFRKDVGYSYCNLGFYVCERKCVEVIGNIFDNPDLLGLQTGGIVTEKFIVGSD